MKRSLGSFEDRRGLFDDAVLLDDDFLDRRVRGDLVHGLEEYSFDNHPQGPCAGACLFGLLCHCLEGIFGEGELDVLLIEELGILLDDGVFRGGENLHQVIDGELVAVGDAVESTDKFRNEAKVDEVFGLYF